MSVLRHARPAPKDGRCGASVASVNGSVAANIRGLGNIATKDMAVVSSNVRRGLPSVDEALRDEILIQAARQHGRVDVVNAVRAAIAHLRREIESASGPVGSPLALVVSGAVALLEQWSGPSPRPVLNLTGIVIHTNLGRAPLPAEAIEAMAAVARDPSDLEFNLDSGRRADRDDHLEALLRRLTGAEAATVVNNNAAALMLVLNTLALRKDVPVSRGQLIEIGGSFRLPEIMARSGARLREVGTTNRTRIDDYRAAIGPRTALLMEVHTSNYEIQGFTASVSTRQLSDLAGASGIPLLVDLGSGSLIDLGRHGLRRESTVQDVLADGADLAIFSGDKLLGGPQAGIIVGRTDLVARIKRNPMKRALRVDKLTIAALAEVLKLYRDPERLASRLPVLRLLSRDPADIDAQARRILPYVRKCLEGRATVETAPCESQAGSGALPTAAIPSTALTLRPVARRGEGKALRELAHALRQLPVPVIGRLQQGCILLDLRCLEDDRQLLAQLEHLASGNTTSAS